MSNTRKPRRAERRQPAAPRVPVPVTRQRPDTDSPADLFDRPGAAALVGMPLRSFDRAAGLGRVAALKLSPRCVRYRRDDLEDFMAGCRQGGGAGRR